MELIEYRDKLTKPQWEAVSHKDGPLLILAGAGSGKTRVITYRICHLIKHFKIRPSGILAMTFTNKAANEMKERATLLIGNDMDNVSMGTFHSVCVRILRSNLGPVNNGKGFQIFDGDDQIKLVKMIFKNLNYDLGRTEPRAVLSRISKAKNNRISPEKFRDKCEIGLDFVVANVYKEYEKGLKKNNALDFDDLLLRVLKLFSEHPDILETYQNRWKYLMVDEFQDTNVVQMGIISLIANRYKNLCVVGDDDQSIYRWRGAEPTNILNFDKAFPGAKIVKLEQNYRSTRNILTAASSMIKNNFSRREKTLWTQNDQGQLVGIKTLFDEQEEARFVSAEVRRLAQINVPYGKMAVLYRVNAQSRALEESFRREQIPYRIIGGLKFYDRKEIKDILAYLRLINNTSDNFSLSRIINTPARGIGKTTLKKLIQEANKQDTSVYDAIADVVYRGKFNTVITGKLKKFYDIIQELIADVKRACLSDLIGDVIKLTGYREYIRKLDEAEGTTRLENVMELVSATQDFENNKTNGDLGAYLDHIALLTDIDKDKEDEYTVSMMTLHSAKGLEFKAVFMVGLEMNLLPHAKSMDSEAELEEERRLCYVGITRAQEWLYMTHCENRSMFGKTSENPPSLFLSEMPESCLRRG